MSKFKVGDEVKFSSFFMERYKNGPSERWIKEIPSMVQRNCFVVTKVEGDVYVYIDNGIGGIWGEENFDKCVKHILPDDLFAI